MRQTENNQLLYNREILNRQMVTLDKTPEQVASEARISVNSVHAGLSGHLGTLKKLRRLADTLEVKWEYITTIDLPESEFHRALQIKKRVR